MQERHSGCHWQCWDPRHSHPDHRRPNYGHRYCGYKRFGNRAATGLHLSSSVRYQRISCDLEFHVSRPSVHDGFIGTPIQSSSMGIRQRRCSPFLQILFARQSKDPNPSSDCLARRRMCNPARLPRLRRSCQRICYQVCLSFDSIRHWLTYTVPSLPWPFSDLMLRTVYRSLAGLYGLSAL